MFSILIGIFGFDNSKLIEDIIQETFLSAMKTWRIKGLPENAEGWLMQVAKNKLINELKKRSNRARLNERFANEDLEDKIEELFLDSEIKDSQLRALFACCNPLLNTKDQIMLTLKALCGFSNKEIASALYSTPEAVKKAIYRAKSSIQQHQIQLGTPFMHEIPERIEAVHTIIYLIFNEGYKQTSGETLVNEDLCYEASRLAVLLVDIEGDHQSNTHALLALIFFSMARFPARSNSKGDMIELEFQDRTKWDKSLIYTAMSFLSKSRSTVNASKYHFEATIASLHCTANSFEETDWKAISFCYQKLLSLEDNPVLRINYVVALSKWKGADRGLYELELIEGEINKPLKYLFYSAKASMFMEIGKYDLAKSYYQVAHDLSKHKMDQSFLVSKMIECDLALKNTSSDSLNQN